MKKLTDILSGIEYTCDKDVSSLYVDSVANDSRKATFDSLFIAIKGAIHNGHDYADKAYASGCRIFVCEHKVELPDDAYQIITSDTRKALAIASSAIYSHPSKKLRIIALTGTKGKTTTAYLIYSLLCASGKAAAYIGSNGIDYGEFHYDTANTTPESCELHYHFSKMVAAGIEFVAMEVSSQALYMNRVYGIDFETVVFTNLSDDDHIGGDEHPTFEHYRDCKRSLFFDYNAKNMVYNADDSAASYMVNPALSLYPISCKDNGSFCASEIEPFKENGILGISFKMKTSRSEYSVRTCSPGAFSAYNAMCAMVCAKLCGVNFSSSAKKLARLSVVGRFECVDAMHDRNFIIDYAHNGFSLRSVLTALLSYPHNRMICLFGSVGGRTVSRRAALGKVAEELCDYTVITSDNPDCEPPMDIIDEIAQEFEKTGNRRYVKIADRDMAIKHAVEISEPGDIILLAGKGHEKYQLISRTKVPFCERDLLFKYAKEYAKKQKEASVR